MSTPSRARSVAAWAAIAISLLAIVVSSRDSRPLVIWGAVVLPLTVLMLHERDGAIMNFASMVSGRPIALTARGRRLIELDSVTSHERRVFRVVGLMVVTFVLLGIVLDGVGE
ncbi:MAG TPA: hypothetical protein VGW75_03195 [Solirubrobacteraceae bacterium]|jgi:hypothetical protein|nr:hypothetical protein [Solirubrobacteraceae bacterium]